jgi:signal transduction histidine kinase
MGTDTAWHALGQRPRRLLASPWPWRSLAYLLCGIAPSGVVAAVILVLLASKSSNAAPWVLPPVVLALLLSGPAMARYEHWRLRLIQVDPAPGPYRRGKGAHRALQIGYGVVCTVALWLIDLAVVVASLAVPAGLAIALARSGGAGWGTRAAMLAAAVVALPLAAYPLTAWAGARAALARLILAPREAELSERLVEVTRSRARLADAFELERRRIERDLHDGAQQRLVALTVALGMARLDLPSDSAAAEQVGAAQEQAKRALTELRELIRGVHPQVLTDRGLPAAIADAAGRSPVAVEVDVALPGRLPGAVEVAAYFAVCEALVNVARHSRATTASVRGRLLDGVLVVEVHDDGVGGADPAAGSGLAGLADRIAVVDGRLLLSSPPGGPTLLRMEIPCRQTAPFG